MMENYVLDDKGNPVPEPDIRKWAKWFEKGNRKVASTDLPNHVSVSTVFLGLDHSFDPGPHVPVLWETMIFGGPHDGYQDRYTSLEDAKKGHEAAVNLATEVTDGNSNSI